MSLRKQLETMLAKKDEEHTKNQAVYHKHLKEKANAEKKARAACVKASATANEVASLRKALAEMPEDPEEAAA